MPRFGHALQISVPRSEMNFAHVPDAAVQSLLYWERLTPAGISYACHANALTESMQAMREHRSQ